MFGGMVQFNVKYKVWTFEWITLKMRGETYEMGRWWDPVKAKGD